MDAVDIHLIHQLVCSMDMARPSAGRRSRPQIPPLYIIVLVWFYVTPDRGTTASVARRAPILYGANGQYIDPPPPPVQIQFIFLQSTTY